MVMSMDQDRPDPDDLLRIVKKNELSPSGKLKIFFGYAAGVGKTYSMLMAAHAAKKTGIDVVAGYIEPHLRPETAALMDGLERLEPLNIEHKSIILKEFDLDKAIERHPELILVDELAHTNAEGCRHLKRYQDIEELLKAGINVYTTINVQHIESLNDIVASITGVVVRERIPDRVFDNANQVELVDIEPADLIERLNRGKIYKDQQAQYALNNFFSVDNLIALREIALRRTADRVNKISENAKQISKSDYYTGEHILICLSSSPTNAKVIRTAARLASAFHGIFTALFVETSDFQTISPENMRRLRDNLKLAEQLGARIVTLNGDDVAFQIAEYAKLSGVSKIVLGRTNTKKRLFFPKQSFSENVTAMAPNLDIYIIPDTASPKYKPKHSTSIKYQYSFSFIDTLKATGLLVLATLLGLLMHSFGFSDANVIMVYILGALFTALVTSNRLYSIISALLSVLVFNFFFTDPKYTLAAYDTGYPVTFLSMFITAFIAGTLTMRVKEHARKFAQKTYRTEILLETSQKLQRAESKEDIIKETTQQIVKLFSKTITYYDAHESGLANPRVITAPDELEDTNKYIIPNEQAVAQWVYKNNKHAGATTSTLPDSKCFYLAIRGVHKVLGVIGIACDQTTMDVFDSNLLIALLSESAQALEKQQLNEAEKKAAMKAQQEQLRANLLRSISHDLRTPLTSISGNASVLIGNSETISSEKKHRLYTDIYDDSIWLINLVENLLSVTRIEDGTMRINMEAELLQEVIDEALLHINRKSEEHNIHVDIDDDLIMAKMDSRLIVQVIINIVDNAIKYTPIGSNITISVKKFGNEVVIEIADDGVGISDDAKDRLFDMFYTTNSSSADSRRGLGLGLALCKSIVNAHSGVISVRDNYPHGSIFSFTLQAEEVTLNEQGTTFSS